MDRPMILIYIASAIGISAFFIFQYMGIIPTLICISIFFLFIVKLNEKIFSYILLGFFIFGIINSYIFFNVSLSSKEYRILEQKYDYYIVENGLKKYKVFSHETLLEGQRYILEGTYKKSPEFNRGILGELQVKKVLKIKEDIFSKIFNLKSEFYNKLLEIGVSEEKASIILALSLGDSTYISYESRERLNVLGISHIISVSGLHLSLIYGILGKVFGYKAALILSFIFVIITGMKASTCRAFIMIFLLAMSTKVKRKYDSTSALAMAAFVLILIKPYYILDLGYVLSFLAVAGILAFNNKLQRKLYRFPSFISNSLCLTMSSMIFTAPYLILTFRSISIGGLISNIILIPFYTLQLILGILSFLLMRFESIFIILINSEMFIFNIIENLEKILLKVLPDPMIFTYFQGFALVFLYLVFLLIRSGKKELIYFPIVLIFFIYLESYKIVPVISFIASKNNSIIQVDYRGRIILIGAEKVKLKYVYEDIHHIDRIYDEFEEEILINLDRLYSLHISKNSGELELMGIYKEGGTLLIIKDEDKDFGKNHLQCNNLMEPHSFNEKYDIMVFENDISNRKLGRYYCKLIMVGPWLFNKYIY